MFAAFRWNRRISNLWPDFVSRWFAGHPELANRATIIWHDSNPSSTVDGRGNVGEKQRMGGCESATRGILWVDAVGGFLVCLDDAVKIGQAVPGTDVHIAIMGDVSRLHAVIRRENEDYVVEPMAPLCVDRRLAKGPTPIQDGDELWLGEKVRIRFRQPNPLSNTARLDFLTRHRTQPLSDGVILMGQTCLLGPTARDHVYCQYWPEGVILSRGDGDRFRFVSSDRVEIDGHPAADSGLLGWNSRLAGNHFALRLERL
jgi:hypothetical protein